MKIQSVYFVQPAPIANVTMSSVYLGKDGNRIESMEWAPQGLLIRVKGYARTVIVGHANIKSAELVEGEEATATGAPPVDNEHVAPGCEPFSEETIAVNRKGAKRGGK